jgi:hypothetical protein
VLGADARSRTGWQMWVPRKELFFSLCKERFTESHYLDNICTCVKSENTTIRTLC